MIHDIWHMKRYLFLTIFSCLAFSSIKAQTRIIPGAERMEIYLPMLKGKRIGLFANQTSMVGNTHLLDTLLAGGITVTKIFGPEHGFRGRAAEGEKVESFTDPNTGIPVVSLYGSHSKPTQEDLQDVDILIFDIQDVGTRFYTYISSLQYFMEAAFECSKPLLVLDRPNPNGFYVDGPVLEPAFKSFVGMQPVPIVYGMTVGEYALMIAGEKWLSEKANNKYSFYQHAENSADTPFHFLVIKNLNYDHKSKYVPPVKPSPNLPNIQSIYLYPSTCFFEGTVLSEGRGTDKPFQIFGHTSYPKTMFAFTPRGKGGGPLPKLGGKTCYGWDLSGSPEQVLDKTERRLQLKWLLDAYRHFPDKKNFFLKTSHFHRLAGNDELMQQIIDGVPEAAIRKSWEPGLQHFKTIRKKYLMYEDFE